MSKRYRGFCFTINNFTDADEVALNDLFDPLRVKYLVYGYEVGKLLKTQHIQGYVEFKNARTLSAVSKQLVRAHLEPRRGTPTQASQYCKKDGNFVEHGTLPQQGKRNDLSTLVQLTVDQSTVKEMIMNGHIKNNQQLRFAENLRKYLEPTRNTKPHVTWIFGDSGTGKTKSVFDSCEDEPYVAMSTIKWWDGYDQHKNVLIDDFRRDFCKYHELLTLLDRYPYRVEIKGGTRQLLAENMFITSCYSPWQIYETREDLYQLLRRIDTLIYYEKIDCSTSSNVRIHKFENFPKTCHDTIEKLNEITGYVNDVDQLLNPKEPQL